MSKKIKSNHNQFKKESKNSIYNQFENSTKKTSPAQRESYLESLSDSLKLPGDILAGAVIITATGRSQVCVENYKGIIEYNGQLIKIQTKLCKVSIEGNNLNIDYYTNDEMRISGNISRISYH